MKKLSPRQELYCIARAEGQLGRDAALAAGVNDVTGRRWHLQPAVLARIDELQADVADEVLRHFRSRALRAARRITECIEPGYNIGNTASVNLDAAKTTLRFVGLDPGQKTQLSGSDGGPLVINLMDFGADGRDSE